MISISYPAYQPKIQTAHGRQQIFDPFRKKWVALTPEEWVRQHFLQYLLQVKNYPASLIAIEREIVVGALRKRFDIVVFDSAQQPFMLIECKETGVKLEQQVLEQALRYNIPLLVPYVVITNGNSTCCFHLSGGNLLAQEEIPPHQ